jgi:GTP-binding protein
MEKKEIPVFAISAVTGQGTRELLYAVLRMLESMPAEPVSVEEPKVFRPAEEDDAFEVVSEGRQFRLRGRRVERMAAMMDWTNDEAVSRFQRRLKAMGVLEALERSGVKVGDTVVINDYELEWE